MPPRPIHRSKIFWLGIFIITFLGWSWWDSTRASGTVSYRRLSITHGASGISLAYWAHGSGPGAVLQWKRQKFPTSDLTWSRAYLSAPEAIRITDDPAQVLTYFPEEPISDGTTPRNPAAYHFDLLLWAAAPDSRAIYLPHWLLLLTFITLWSALLLWRHRRIHRLTKHTG